MKNLVRIVFITLTTCSYSQNEFGIGFSMTSSNYIAGLSSKNNSKERVFIGSGFLLMMNQRFKKSKTSSLIYGLEYSSTKHTIFHSGSASVKIPLLYQFEFKSDKSISPIVRIGINNLIQFSQITVTELRRHNEYLTTDKRGGFYPMVQLNFGTRFSINNRHSILLLLGANKGFILNKKLRYINKITGSEQYFESDGSYFDLKVIWGFKKKIKKTTISESLSK